MFAVNSSSLIVVGGEVFPVVVDYTQEVRRSWEHTLGHVRSWGNIEFGQVFPNAQLGRREFICRYAILQQDDSLGELESLFEGLGLRLADQMQLFAFTCSHVGTEITVQKPSAVVAASPCSTWRCSHGILREMVGVEWDPWYHAPGPTLHTVSESPGKGFGEGTRFLVFE